MDFFFEEELLMLLPGLLSGIPTGLFGIAAYVLTSLAIYTISRRRGLKNPWLAWVPVVNCWLLGLNLVQAVIALSVVVLAAFAVAGAIFSVSDAAVMRSVNGPLMGILGLILPLVSVSIALCVIRYMALYDVYRSLDPNNAVLYLVLSILFSPTEPFFLFFNREKDLGMPPRKQRPVIQPEETFETVEDYEYE